MTSFPEVWLEFKERIERGEVDSLVSEMEWLLKPALEFCNDPSHNHEVRDILFEHKVRIHKLCEYAEAHLNKDAWIYVIDAAMHSFVVGALISEEWVRGAEVNGKRLRAKLARLQYSEHSENKNRQLRKFILEEARGLPLVDSEKFAASLVEGVRRRHGGAQSRGFSARTIRRQIQALLADSAGKRGHS